MQQRAKYPCLKLCESLIVAAASAVCMSHPNHAKQLQNNRRTRETSPLTSCCSVSPVGEAGPFAEDIIPAGDCSGSWFVSHLPEPLWPNTLNRSSSPSGLDVPLTMFCGVWGASGQSTSRAHANVQKLSFASPPCGVGPL